jgi:uncharacterized YigZ family protein
VKTLIGTATLETEIKRSRFVAHAGRVDSTEDTLSFYERVADPSATHNCWAWRIADRYRFNDDGEPGGTAGRPILSAIEGKALDHAMVVVTRYFGGTKLGAGGLVRAYSGAAARCLDQARIVDVELRLEFCVEAGFDWTGQVYAVLEACGAHKREENFGNAGFSLRADLPRDRFARLCTLLGDATRGEARVRKYSDDAGDPPGPSGADSELDPG